MVWRNIMPIILLILLFVLGFLIYLIYRLYDLKKYAELEKMVLSKLGFTGWNIVPYFDTYVTVKSHQTLDKYDQYVFFRENEKRLTEVKSVIERKKGVSKQLKDFLVDNEFKDKYQYSRIAKQINSIIINAAHYRVKVIYTTPSGRTTYSRELIIETNDINRIKKDPTLLMTKGEYSSYLKAKEKEILEKKHREYYESVNAVIDYANENKDKLLIRGSQERLDALMTQMFDRTVNSIKKIKSIDSEEWELISNFISRIKDSVEEIVFNNQKVQEYYESDDFLKIKDTCGALMNSQKEFNEYITEKAQMVSQLFGTRIVRNETINEDEYNYIRPYKKTITPFTAEVSANVFASAENNPLKYIAKIFYPNKSLLPEQIQKLYLLVEELETLKEAKQIIENYKLEYREYLKDVPDYIMKFDEAGFYSKLGFANIDESVLAVEYRFSYTSGGGMAQRFFTVPMTEETITELISVLQNKLTTSDFAKEQRVLMTKKLRETIKIRDNFTCCACGNSVYVEPNLLLEIDHIIPVSKGGYTTEENLQTLCWKCNRSKSNKLINT